MMLMIKIWLLVALNVLIAKAIAGELNLDFQQNDYQLKFERVELVRYNRDILQDPRMKTFKYNRTSAVVNITFTLKVDTHDDLEAEVQAYAFMSNEYRLYPIHFAMDACKAVAADVGGIKSETANCGNFTGCPFVKGKPYHACNWYPNQSKFPPFIPNGQYKVELQFLHSSVEVGFVAVYATVFRPFG